VTTAVHDASPHALVIAPRWVMRHVPGEAVYLLSERETVVIEDPTARECLLLIDGLRDADGVVMALLDADARADAAAAYFRIDDLIANGHVTAARDARSAQSVGGELGLSAGIVTDRLNDTVTVAAIGAADDDVHSVTSLLAESGVTAHVVEGPAAEQLAADPACGHLLVLTDDYANPALAPIDRARRAAGQPFFVWYAPLLPHDPHTPPERLLAKYRDKVPSIHVARYLAMIEWFDESVGELLKMLDDRGLTKNTLVAYVADNGWIQNPETPRFAPRSKLSQYDGGLRTPILLRQPAQTVTPARRTSAGRRVPSPLRHLLACGSPPAGSTS
jgi:hypothetical protein